METTISSLAKNIGLALLEATALLVASTFVSQGLRNATSNTTKYLGQAFRFTTSRLQKKAA